MKLMCLTSKTIVKAISLLIVFSFLFVQVVSASHIHSDVNDTPEPSVCMICLASTQDDNGDIDTPPSPPMPFAVPNTLDFDLACISEATFALRRDDENVVRPPNFRPSAPRAPPV